MFNLNEIQWVNDFEQSVRVSKIGEVLTAPLEDEPYWFTTYPQSKYIASLSDMIDFYWCSNWCIKKTLGCESITGLAEQNVPENTTKQL